MDHEVRRIGADEWRQYRQLRLEALRDSPLAFVEQYEESLTRPDEFWQDRINRSAVGDVVSTFVAVHAGAFVGKTTCLIEADVPDHVSAHIVGVYVTPRLRGHGVAEALFAAAIRWAEQEVRADRIRLFVLESNDRAAAFYRRIGFAATGATMPYPPDPIYTEYEMEYRGRPGSNAAL
jgi:ribosomal protein S18 acetylase RimI-like enzyme